MALVPILVLSGLHQLFHANYTVDDAYISFRYAENLASGNGLVFNVGERVEGYSNFLYTLLLSFAAKAGVDPVLASKVIGICFGLSTLIVLWRFSVLVSGDDRSLLNLFGPLLLAVSTDFAVWCVAGLETPMYTFLVLVGMYLFVSQDRLSARILSPVLFALVALTRAEGVAFLVMTLAYVVLWRLVSRLASREIVTEVLTMVAVFAAIYVPFLMWRLVYYGQILPNSVYAKNALGAAIMHTPLQEWLPEVVVGPGVQYVVGFFVASGGLVLAPVVIPLVVRETRWWARYLGCGVGLLVLVAIWNSGDWMPHHRLLVPAIPLVALLLQEGLRVIWCRWTTGKTVSSGLARAAVPLTCCLVLMMNLNEYAPFASGKDRQYVKLGRQLETLARPGQTLATYVAGAVPYYSGLYTIDMHGLMDRHIAHTGVSAGNVGKMDNAYVLSREPAYVVAHSMVGWVQLLAYPSFDESYVFVDVSDKVGPGVYLFLNRDATNRGAITSFYGVRERDVVGSLPAGVEDEVSALLRSGGVKKLDWATCSLLRQAWTFAVQGDVERAVARLHAANELDGESAEAYLLRGRVYVQLGHPDAAVADLTRAILLNPKLVEAHFSRGLIYLDAEKYALALEGFDKVVELDPYHAEAYLWRGRTLLGLARSQAALADFSKAISLNSELTEAHFNRAVVYLRTGRPDLAIGDLDTVVELNPSHAEAYFQRAYAYYLQGKCEQAAADLDVYLELAPSGVTRVISGEITTVCGSPQ